MGNKEKKSLSATADLGDKRLGKRLEKLCSDLTTDLRSPITSASKNRAGTKGAYRFFSNKKVNAAGIIEAHVKTLGPLSGEDQGVRRILQIDDTTEFDYTGKRGAADLGVLNYENRKGVHLHNSLLVSDLGVPFGIFKQTAWSRDPEYLGNSEERRSWPLEDKESFRWYDHFTKGQQVCREMTGTEWVYIADREADFMELLVARTCERMHFVIRAQYDRNLFGEKEKLSGKLSNRPLRTAYTIGITDPRTKKKRQAELEVRCCPVTLQLCKKHPSGYTIPPTTINAVQVREVNPPGHLEKPVHWVLLTTLDINTIEEVRSVIEYYVLRWLIERFFYLLKSGGADVEKLQLKTQKRLENAVATYSISIMNVMKMRYLAQNQPDAPINELGVTPCGHEALYTVLHQHYPKKIIFDPEKIPTIEEFCIALGLLGGFYPSKRQPLPGLKVLTRAFDKYHLIVDVFLLNRMSKN